MDPDGQIYLLELNSMASLGETGSYPTSAKVAGYDYTALVNKMLDVAAVRYFADETRRFQMTETSQKMPLSVRMRGFLRGRQETYEKMLRKAVNINTYVRNVEGVNEFGKLLREELSLLGFAQEVHTQVEVGNALFFSNSYEEEYDMLLLGNLDNSNKLSEHEYFKYDDQRLFGTGIWEHKAGIVAAIAALQTLKFTRLLKKCRIGILLTSDNSLQGRFARKLVQQKLRLARVVFSLHGGDSQGSVVTSRSGAAVYKSNINLMQGNSQDVALAASVFSKVVSSWCELSIDDKSLVISPSNMSFTSNIVQPYAHGEVQLSVRFNDLSQFEEVETRIRKLVPKSRYRKNLHFQIDGGLRRPPMMATEQVQQTWEAVRDIARSLDIRLVQEHRWSSSDICFVDDDRYMLDGLGPVGMKPEKKTENILRHILLERALLLAMAVYRISKGDLGKK